MSICMISVSCDECYCTNNVLKTCQLVVMLASTSSNNDMAIQSVTVILCHNHWAWVGLSGPRAHL